MGYGGLVPARIPAMYIEYTCAAQAYPGRGTARLASPRPDVPDA